MTRNEINGRAAITLTGDLEKDLDEFSCNQDLTVIDSDGLEYTVRELKECYYNSCLPHDVYVGDYYIKG